MTEKFRQFEENLLTIDGKLTKRNNVNSDSIAVLQKEAKNIQPMLKEIQALKLGKANQSNLEFLSRHLETNFTKLDRFIEFKDKTDEKIHEFDLELERLDKVFTM